MVRQKYNPKDKLDRIKLMMRYDLSKNLNENKESLLIEDKFDFPSCVRIFDLKKDESGKQYLRGYNAGGRGNYEGYKFYENGEVITNENKKGKYSCSGTKIVIKDVGNQTSNNVGNQTSNNTSNTTTSTSKLFPIPKELKDRNGVIKFQTWVRDTIRKPEFLGPKGVDGLYGLYTKGAWEDFGSEYLKSINTNNTSTTNTSTTKPRKPTPRDFGDTSGKLKISSTGGVSTGYLKDGSY